MYMLSLKVLFELFIPEKWNDLILGISHKDWKVFYQNASYTHWHVTCFVSCAIECCCVHFSCYSQNKWSAL